MFLWRFHVWEHCITQCTDYSTKSDLKKNSDIIFPSHSGIDSFCREVVTRVLKEEWRKSDPEIY